MGIRALLPALETAISPCHIRELGGLKAGIDVSGWIHKVLRSNGVKQYVMRQVQLLRQHNVEPVLVFDGADIEAKKETMEERARNRLKYMEEAQVLLEKGDEEGARKLLLRTGVRTEELQNDLKHWCRLNGVWVIQSPFEADAQLAFMMQEGLIDFVISEDADMILYGCRKVLLKWDWGKGDLFDAAKMTTLWGAPFDLECFRAVCIGIGCDYMRGGIKNFGIEKAKKVFKDLSPHFNLQRFMSLARKFPNISLKKEFPDAFKRAVSTFKYQLVYDPMTCSIVPVTAYPTGESHSTFQFAGCMEIAQGDEWKPPVQFQLHSHLSTSGPVDTVLAHVYYCVHCTEHFESSDLLRRHKNKEHPLRCPVCQVPHVCKAYLVDHMKIHDEAPTLPCDVCNKLCWTSRQLYIHKLSHRPKTIKCTHPGCDEVFRRKGTMLNHLQTHDPNRQRVRCAECGNDFASPASLRCHQHRPGRCKGKAPANNTKITDFFKPRPEL